MNSIFVAQNMLMSVIGIAVFAMMAWALIDCVRTRADAFPAAGKKSKQFWLLLTGGATAVGFIFMLNPFNIFNLIAIIAAAVYHADVRPALKSVQGRGGRTSQMGPYGPW